MKYSCIEIRPTPKFCKEPWEVKFDDTDSVDRISCKKYIPHSLGFFHFPRKWGAQKGFDILKKDMIEKRKERIKSLQKDIEAIESLQLPEWAK